MINEIPYLAQNEFNCRRRMISKQFHHMLRMSERNNLNAPPEAMREHLVAASKMMKLGDWRKCCEYTVNEKLNKQIWSRFHNSKEVIAMLTEKIKEESLRTYLFTYSQFYSNISLQWLAKNFELPEKQISSIITKMMLTDSPGSKSLSASWDGPSQSLVMHGTEPTRLQNIALQLSHKVSAITELNDKIATEQQHNKLYSSARNQWNNRGGQGGNRGQGDRRGGNQGGDRQGQNNNYNNKGGDRRNDNRQRDGERDRRDNNGQQQGGDRQKRDYKAY